MLGSGLPYNIQKFVPLQTGGNLQEFLGQARTPWQKQVDFRFSKSFLNLNGNDVAVTASIFNVFNTQNLGCYDGVIATPDNPPQVGATMPNPHYGKAGCVVTDGRRVQFGATYNFR